MKSQMKNQSKRKLQSQLSTLAAASLLTVASSGAMAQDVNISITNLTQGIYFTPLLVAAHSADASLFNVGEQASEQLQAMAEGGDISGLSSVLESVGADMMANPAEGLLGPAASTDTMLMTADGNMYLSITAMMLPTNDGFVGLDSWAIPAEAGTYTIYLNAYDAGTEANDELVIDGSGAPGTAGIPAAPGGDAGTGGSGVTSTESNMNVHVHRGALGDDDATGGSSDLDNRVHRWLNPVAKVTVTVE